jgi:cytidylate kinase
MKRKLVITVDGPAGVGKSSVSKALSKRISYIYLDTGALYRTVAFSVVKAGISPDDQKTVSELCGNLDISLKVGDAGVKIFADGEDVTKKIRTEEIGILASKVSAIPEVRKALLPIQRKMARPGGVIAEGRDMGTVVFPDADVKFFIKAQLQERTKRRYMQLARRGVEADFEEVKKGIVIRDRQDTKRDIAPLRPADDSFIIDTTDMIIDEVIEQMLGIIRKKTKPY